MEKSIFEKHPSKILNELYSKRNYQGANPMEAQILFVGRDPNWAFNVETQEMFNFVSEYLTDGVTFWENYNIHHPFLLPNYKGDGKRYHKIFSKLNVENSLASKISFVELIGFPTTGMAKTNNKVFLKYLISAENRNHLIELDKLLNDCEKTIFVAWGLLEDFKFLNAETGLFRKLAEIDKSEMNISELNQHENIYVHRHFSDAISNATLEKMKTEIKRNIK